jgi:hypothetical protein
MRGTSLSASVAPDLAVSSLIGPAARFAGPLWYYYIPYMTGITGVYVRDQQGCILLGYPRPRAGG